MKTSHKIIFLLFLITALVMYAFNQSFNALFSISTAGTVVLYAGLKRRCPNHILYRIFISAISLFLISFIAVEGLIFYSLGKTSDPPPCDYMIILGAGLWGENLSPILTYRMAEALDYLREHPNTQVIVSGGQGTDEPFSEAFAMKAFLISRGFPDNQIITEDHSTSTKENIKYSKEILDTLKIDPNTGIALVTSDFHMLRSRLIAWRYGLKVHGVAAETPQILLVNFLPREYFALIKTLIFDLL